ncbi:MAG: hypothetical protein OEX22_05325 [Cyclobacteriaceae bacterium]|nr:hypothetical protein [Cyclobacteriaceae bacterium]
MKNKNKQTPQEEREYSDSTPKQPQVSFEDLLREFTAEKTDEYEEPVVQESAVEEVEKHEYAFEKEVPTDHEIDEVYQKSIEQAQQLESLDSKELRHDIEYKRFDKFVEEENSGLLDELVEDLSDENGLKKAMIFKEILDKKY